MVMLIKELEEKYAGEWLLVRVKETDELDRPLKGTLVCHSKYRDEVYEKQKHLGGDLYISYAGKIPQKGYAVAF